MPRIRSNPIIAACYARYKQRGVISRLQCNLARGIRESKNMKIQNQFEVIKLSNDVFKGCKPLSTEMASVLNNTFKRLASKTPKKIKQ